MRHTFFAMNKVFWIIGLCALTMPGCIPARAAENIVLRTGFRLHADRHEVDGGAIRVFSGDGVTEMPISLVAGFEPLEPAAPPAPAIPAATPQPAPTLPAPAPQDAQAPAELAESAARKYALPYAFLAGVMRTESGFNPAALSPKGAIGLMQLMPDTARTMGVDPNKPAENADAGARYLRDLLVRYQDSPDQVVLALAAYNAGPAAVDKYHGVPPYRETREYILRVLKIWNPPPAPK